MENTVSVNQLIEALDDEDESVRINAAINLAKRGDSIAIPVLIEALGHESQAIRFRWVRQALEKLGERAIPALMEILNARESRVRVSAAYVLYCLDNTTVGVVVPVLENALCDANEAIRCEAAQALGEIGKPAQAAVPALIQMLNDKGAIAEASRAPWFTSSDCGVAPFTLAVIGEPVSDVVSALVSVLRRTDVSDCVQWSAAGALRIIGEPASVAVPLLMETFRDSRKSARVRIQAAYTLAAIGEIDRDIVPLFTDGLQDKDQWIRLYSARLLGEMAELPKSPVPKWLKNAWGEWVLRPYFSKELGALTNPAEVVVPALIQALVDDSRHVRRMAAYALAKTGEPAAEAVPALIETMKTEDVGGVAAEALVKIGQPAMSALIDAARDKAEILHRHAIYALKKMDAPKAKKAITETKKTTPIGPFPTAVDFKPAQPDFNLNDEKVRVFEDLYQSTLDRGIGSIIDYNLTYPKHEFLTYLIGHKNVVLHGSSQTDIEVFVPIRKSFETEEDRDANGVYAAPDAILTTYFASCDRVKIASTNNGYSTEKDASGRKRRFYLLAIGIDSDRENPWSDGMVYILPRDTFVKIHEWEWVSKVPVQPLAKLPVCRKDIPFAIWRKEWRQPQLSMGQSDFPFLEAVQIYPIRPRHFKLDKPEFLW